MRRLQRADLCVYSLVMERKLQFALGEYYHVYSRGVEKRNIFHSDADKARFIKLLFLANNTNQFIFRDIEHLPLKDIDRGDGIVAIGAYCLMPNHFHILIKQTTENGLSMFMQKLTTGYSMYFNRKHDRVGPLFQSRFKAEHVNEDGYLKYLFAYIHLNSIKLIEPRWREEGINNTYKAKQFLKDYKYSSYQDYTNNTREEALILSRSEFPEYFESMVNHAEFINELLKPNNRENDT